MFHPFTAIVACPSGCGNVNLSLKITEGVCLIFGLWRPNDLTGFKEYLYNFYSVISLMSIVGTYIISQVGDLVQVWGNLALMTGTAFLLLTNISLGTKIINTMWRKKKIQQMIVESNQELSRKDWRRAYVKSCNDDTTRQLSLYFAIVTIVVLGWGASAEKNQLPLRAWYPYDSSKTPAYQLTYAYQCIAIFLAATINICLDTMVTSLISLCRCRLKLLCMSLASLCDGLDVADDGRLTAAGDKLVSDRLCYCAIRHQAVLAQVSVLQSCFSAPILVQFSVSLIILCVTAYQLAFEATSLARVTSMAVYFIAIVMQVFIYCYEGHQLVIESEAVSTAAYECPWYVCDVPVRRSLLILMTRSSQAAQLSAGGFTNLSLACFMSIMKASYSFYTVLKQVEET